MEVKGRLRGAGQEWQVTTDTYSAAGYKPQAAVIRPSCGYLDVRGCH